MAKIHLLPPEIISKIAAGEVIERPASVIKELVENSLDAQSDSIELELTNAGKTLIRIKDNGSGIEPEDIEKVFFRHSTSKINSLQDLEEINSLGFRGEALYSVAAISDVILRSRTRTNESGREINCRGCELISLHPCGIPYGTEIEVKELFFNTPARKKFLKSDTTEFHQILNTFIPYTILHPKVCFMLTHNGKKIFALAQEESYTRRIAKALRLKEEHLLETNRDYPQEDLSIHVILGDINIQRADKNLQFIFINDRPVQNRNLNFHINQVYKLLLPVGTKPFFAVYLRMPAASIDVNIHPSKREVKIKDEDKIIPLLRYACEHTLMTEGKAKQAKNKIFELPPASLEAKEKTADFIKADNQTNSEKTFLSAQDIELIPLASDELPQQNTLIKTLSGANFIGIFKKKYLLFETENSILLIDQHAAHERINFELLSKQIENGKVEIQNILSPLLLRMTHQEMSRWLEIKDNLEALGFATTLWDDESIAIHSHPQLINNPEIALRYILSVKEAATHDITTLARRACRQSIMVGDIIKKETAEALRKQLLQCADPFTCPHGRPTLIEIQENLLNRQFLRA